MAFFVSLVVVCYIDIYDGNGLVLFDLDSKVKNVLTSNYSYIPENLSQAAFLPNGKLAMVDEHERKVIFNSIRNDRLMKVNSEKLCKIRGIYAFDKEPFDSCFKLGHDSG